MKHVWIKKENTTSLIIFFCGWGMDKNVVEHLSSHSDVIMFYDYRNLDYDESVFEDINKYETKYLIGWSMGVMIGSIFSKKLGPFKKAIAMNGTLYPINDKYGIVKAVYLLMVKGFGEIAKIKFLENMFKSAYELEKIKPPERDLEDQKEELISLMEYKSDEDFKYDCAIISDKDIIIPTKNQINFWKTNPETQIIHLSTGHYPFLSYSCWEDIIDDKS